jgi:ribosomal protein L40E
MYDPNVIKRFAEKLYAQATITAAMYTLAGFLIPFMIGIFLDSMGFGVIAGVVLGAGGYILGQNRAFQLKLEAQTALCQVKIEENTRSSNYQNVDPSKLTTSQNEVRIFKGEKSTGGISPTAKKPATPIATNYRTCLKCLHQNSKTATTCSRCGYKFN